MTDRVKVIEQAEKFVRAGRVREAIAEYEKLAQSDSADVGTLNIIGDLYIRVGQNEPAIRAFERVAAEYERRGLFSQALAICKKINKLSPEDTDSSLKLADLYAQQGFLAESKGVYAAVAGRLASASRTAEAVAIFEKIVKLDREDHDARQALARLYRDSGNLDAAIGQLDDSAAVHIEKGEFDAAAAILQDALLLRPGDGRSVVSLVEVYKRQGQPAKSVELLERELAAVPDNIQLLNILGNLYFEAGETQKAEEIFTRIVTGHPLNVNARIKLGRIQILKDKLDQAYELFEPLINNLVKKHRDEKAIGLLGLILESQKPHLPALERLALIYRSNKEVKKLEVVDRAILDELRRLGEKERLVGIYAELLELRPDDAELAAEARGLRQDLNLPVEAVAEEAPQLSDRDREAIREIMGQADLYLQQGLVRIARRLLENLRFRYPEDPQIVRKIAVLDEVRTHMDEDEIRRRIEKTTVLEAEYKEKAAGKKAEDRKAAEPRAAGPAPAPPAPESATVTEPKAEPARRPSGQFKPEVLEGQKVSTADLFAETDIIPFADGSGERTYYDLRNVVEAELRWLAAVRTLQRGDGSAAPERELAGIVAEFRRDLRSRGAVSPPEMFYQLGLAFMSQGLIAEAIEELSEAARDKALAIDSLSLIAQCHRLKRNFEDATKCLQSALTEATQGTDQYYALLYELAEVHAAAGNQVQAAALFREIRDWNPSFRGVAGELENLEKSSTR
ncbi:MAG TPA: tetratricopeptide repeat protein [Candidatus Aminicenantes bacterium]|nr:tetratricopeptide repeat protein [Candidatus Aminicenantes bacterium]HRY63733.1 tetratricopeptide repeat protein [Candidatus Aminicenantes bacterium]HRZ70646.1 tetratricopeptide repeat protein [Candidatus Aminicenantes bacterium]